MIHLLTKKISFPDPSLAREDGLLSIGGDLRPERLLLAYSLGIFPWFSDDEFIMWFSPHRRFVLFPAEIRISKSMNAVQRSGKFNVTVNNDFQGVVENCAKAKRKNQGQSGTWITRGMQEAYMKLHKLKRAYSIEVWHEDELAGGLYGVNVGNVFCGESMFSKKNNASKIALIHLALKMNYDLIDCQVFTPHLSSMGARFIGRNDYEKFLKQALRSPGR